MKTKSRSAERVLGISATGRAVHAVLLQTGPDGPEVVRRFSRQRTAAATGFEEVTAPAAAPKENFGGSGAADDFTIEFGDGSGSAAGPNLFLSSEFGGVDEPDSDDVGGHVATFELELSDILSEAHDAGYGDATLALTLSAADVTFQEVRVPSKKKQQKHDKATLVEALTAQYKGLFDDERVAFIPMTQNDDSEKRYLAVFPKVVDPASATLAAIRDGNERIPQVALIDAEVSTLVGLARVATDAFSADRAPVEVDFDEVATPEEEEDSEFAPVDDAPPKPKDDSVHTLIVRAGAEDTLVLFMHGDTVHHCESLRSLTAFDAPETICSRVLLQQDEHGMGDVHHVLVLSEERESELTETFGMFFPDAAVEQLRLYVPTSGPETEDAATAVVSATAAALRVLEDPYYASAFEKINFLPKKLLKRKVRLPITWNVVALSVMIVITTVFFMARYTTAETKIDAYRDRLQDVAPNEVSADINTLQARIDSMQQMYVTYTRALEVLDTLLIGSDRWSRILEKTSKEATGVRGLWIENFVPSGNAVELSGNATSRDDVVEFASRLDGTIETLTFSEIREWPVYSFSMKIAVTDSLPEAAQYLREQVKLESVRPGTEQSNVSGGKNEAER